MMPSACNVVTQKRIISVTTPSDFSASYDFSPLIECNDVDLFVQSFNNHCLAVLDMVAPVKKISGSEKKVPPMDK